MPRAQLAEEVIGRKSSLMTAGGKNCESDWSKLGACFGRKSSFHVQVIDSEEVNAFALPGGFLYVNLG